MPVSYTHLFGTEAALRISYFEGDETYIQTLFREAYYASPDTALDLPCLLYTSRCV